MDEAITRFLQYLEQFRNRAANTLLAYRTDVQQMQQVMQAQIGGPVLPDRINAETLAGYVSWLTSQGYRPSTISRKMAAVRSFLDYLGTQERLVEPNLVSGLRPPPTPKRRPRVLSHAEVAKLLELPTGSGKPRALRDAALLALLYATGMRAAETVGLQVENVNLVSKEVRRITQQGRFVPLGKAAEPLRRYLREGRPYLLRKNKAEEALFLNQRGQRLSRQGLWLVVKKWARKMDLGDQVSPHTLRHTLAYHLLGQGMSKREVQRILGLASLSAIRVYPED